MLTLGAMCVLLGIFDAQAPTLLLSTKHLVLPVYPKLVKIAHDSRIISVKVKIHGNNLNILEIKGGNKYYDEAIRVAIAQWTLSPARSLPEGEASIVFDFRMTDDPQKDGVYELDMDDSKIIIWGLKRYTDTEKLPLPTYK